MATNYNPMGYTCAPNAAGPDYVICDNFRTFVAFGMLRCWLGSTSDDPNREVFFPRPVTVADVQDIRLTFLRVLEELISLLWLDVYPRPTGKKEYVEIEVESTHFASPEITGDDDEYVTWNAWLYPDAMALELYCSSQPEPIHTLWLSYDAIIDRSTVVSVITEARATFDYPLDRHVCRQLYRLSVIDDKAAYFAELTHHIWGIIRLEN